MRLGNVLSYFIIRYRSIKLRTLGENVETALSLGSGVDFNPWPNMKALLADTNNSSEPLVVGYINKTLIDDLTEGESAIFSVKENNNPGGIIRFRIDGNVEINGKGDNVVRFTPLEEGIHSTDSDINTELQKIATAIAGVGGSYTPSTIATDISDAKTNEVKIIDKDQA